jgi:hypothetical protein
MQLLSPKSLLDISSVLRIELFSRDAQITAPSLSLIRMLLMLRDRMRHDLRLERERKKFFDKMGAQEQITLKKMNPDHKISLTCLEADWIRPCFQ